MLAVGSRDVPKCVYGCLENKRIYITAAIVAAIFVAIGIGLYFAGQPGTAIGKSLISVGVPILALSILMLAINHFKHKKGAQERS